jgi:hypothetical protein
MSNRTKIARIAAGLEAQQRHAELSRAGGLSVTTPAGVTQQNIRGRRPAPSMPKVRLETAPTPERVARALEGVEQSTGSRAYRVRNPLEIHKARFAPQLVAAAVRYLKNRDAVETAAKTTGDWSGMPNLRSGAAKPGGVHDPRRQDAAELAYVEATLEDEFIHLLDLLAAGVEAHRNNQPKTVADIARAVLLYRNQDSATAAGVGMLWGALVRLNSIYHKLRAYDRKVSTPEEITARLMERRRKAATAAEQFHREAPERQKDQYKTDDV